MKYHVVFTEGGRVGQCEVETEGGFADAEQAFRALHPDATYWEIGAPLVEGEAL